MGPLWHSALCRTSSYCVGKCIEWSNTILEICTSCTRCNIIIHNQASILIETFDASTTRRAIEFKKRTSTINVRTRKTKMIRCFGYCRTSVRTKTESSYNLYTKDCIIKTGGIAGGISLDGGHTGGTWWSRINPGVATAIYICRFRACFQSVGDGAACTVAGIGTSFWVFSSLWQRREEGVVGKGQDCSEEKSEKDSMVESEAVHSVGVGKCERNSIRDQSMRNRQ